MRRNGFTLIEILVVIAIIAILAALLFPTFLRAKDKASRTTCISNMRETGRALNMYLADFDELFPSDRIKPFRGNPVEINAVDGDLDDNTVEREGPMEADETALIPWYERIQPYAKSRQILLCPHDVGRKVDLKWIDDTVKPTDRPISFGTNRWFEFDQAHLKTPLRPSDTILLGEVVGRKRRLPWPFATQYSYEVLEMDIPWWQWFPGSLAWPLPRDRVPDVVARRDLAHDRHGGGSTYLYCDGHIKWATFAQVWGNGQSTNQFWPTRP